MNRPELALGQAGISLVLVVLVLFMSVTSVIDFGQYLIAKVEAQSAADAAALKGATILAQSINAVAVINFVIIVVLTAVVLLPRLVALAAYVLRPLQFAQDVTIKWAPAYATTMALLRGCHGLLTYIPLNLNRLSHPQGPGLDLHRVRFFGVPAWVVSTINKSSSKPYGNRIMRIAVVKRRVEMKYLSRLTGRKLYYPTIFGAAEAAVVGSTALGLPAANHKGRLVKPSIQFNPSILGKSL